MRLPNPVFSIYIRSYEPKDLEACLTCFKTNVPTAFTPEEIGFFEDFLQNRVSVSPDTLPYFVLVERDSIVGCGGLGLNENDTVSLTWGLVRQDCQKRGLGLALLEYRLRKVWELFPGKKLRLDTSQHAAGFFEKHGFQTVGFVPDGYSAGLHRYDMEWPSKTGVEMLCCP